MDEGYPTLMWLKENIDGTIEGTICYEGMSFVICRCRPHSVGKTVALQDPVCQQFPSFDQIQCRLIYATCGAKSRRFLWRPKRNCIAVFINGHGRGETKGLSYSQCQASFPQVRHAGSPKLHLNGTATRTVSGTERDL
jgi:hypothetical protein